MHYDYIIVGCGLAGIAFAEKLRQSNKSFVLFDDCSQQASMVAGGLYNPVMLKRFTLAWKADVQTEIALPYYQELESRLDVKFDYKMPVRRLLHSTEEQNNWFQATDDPVLKHYMSDELIQYDGSAFDCNHGLGEVYHSGRIDTLKLINKYRKALRAEGRLIDKSFKYEKIEIAGANIKYMEISCHRVVFCDGFGLKRNPYFKSLPLNGTKGELLKIQCPDLKIDYILKSSVFLIPLEGDLYLAGSTYNRYDKTNVPSEKGRDELCRRLNKLLNCDYTIVDHLAGVRPTVSDRRPILGTHNKYKGLCVLNGLGSRGVLIAPFAAGILFDHLENETPLPEEIDISRFS
ncbi:MAG: FAD-binding oxidoreductase [Bacteroidia bacterium]|nr:FAD-binding oxidoreductase [Bacteroidia bacterium]